MKNTEIVNILLVDDNQVDVTAVRRAFAKYKIANPLHVARDGAEALELLRDPEVPFPRPYLILLDLNMPRMNGFEFLQEIRSDDALRTSVVFVLTTSQADEDMLASYDHNVAGYIVKSDVGAGFIRLVDMLDRYWKVVELPPEPNA